LGRQCGQANPHTTTPPPPPRGSALPPSADCDSPTFPSPHHQATPASQVIVQKQQTCLGAKTAPPGKSGRALQLPSACAGCGCFTTCTHHGVNSSKRLLKNHPHKLISRYQTKPLHHTSRNSTIPPHAPKCDQFHLHNVFVSVAGAQAARVGGFWDGCLDACCWETKQ
jgi:hypothetical protein